MAAACPATIHRSRRPRNRPRLRVGTRSASHDQRATEATNSGRGRRPKQDDGPERLRGRRQPARRRRQRQDQEHQPAKEPAAIENRFRPPHRWIAAGAARRGELARLGTALIIATPSPIRGEFRPEVWSVSSVLLVSPVLSTGRARHAHRASPARAGAGEQVNPLRALCDHGTRRSRLPRREMQGDEAGAFPFCMQP